MYVQLHQYGFDSVRKRMSSVRVIDDQKYLYVKGSPISVLERCTQIYDGKKIRKLTQEDKSQIEKYIEENANKAMRNLAMAYKPMETYEPTQKWNDVENNLIFL